MLPVELWKSNCKSRSLPVDKKYQKGQSRDNDIFLLFNSKYKRQWNNMIFLQDKHNINAVSYDKNLMHIRHKTGERLGKPRFYPTF